MLGSRSLGFKLQGVGLGAVGGKDEGSTSYACDGDGDAVLADLADSLVISLNYGDDGDGEAGLDDQTVSTIFSREYRGIEVPVAL